MVRTARRKRRIAAAAAVVAMGFTAACGGSSSDEVNSADKPKQESASQAPADSPSESVSTTPAEGQKSTGRTLSKQVLDEAALANGDAQGYVVTEMPGSPPGGEKADKAECRPIAAVISGKPEPVAAASVYRQIVGGKDDQQVVTEFLTAHKPADAQKVLADLRAAIKACAGGFTSRTGDGPSQYSGVKELTAPEAGDDALAYQVTGSLEGESVPLVFHVVRSGATVAIFYTANLVDAKTPEIPAAVVTAQADKLK
jgi:hypothetical protein